MKQQVQNKEDEIKFKEKVIQENKVIIQDLKVNNYINEVRVERLEKDMIYLQIKTYKELSRELYNAADGIPVVRGFFVSNKKERKIRDLRSRLIKKAKYFQNKARSIE